MRKTSNHLVALGITTALLVGSAGIGTAWAYFTATYRAAGGLTIKVQPNTDIYEHYGSGLKQIVITNQEDSVPVFVRAKVYAKPENLEYIAGEGWSATPDAEGWYYYLADGGVVQPGSETATALEVKISWPEGTTTVDEQGNVIEDVAAKMGEEFNVIVVYEATPVQYDASGNLLSPDSPDVDWHLNPNEGGE